MLPPLVIGPPVASTIPSDSAITGLTAEFVDDALAELNGTGIQLKQKLLGSNFVVPAGAFALWVRTLEIGNGVILELADGSTLEIS